MSTYVRELYASSNGDRWYLGRDEESWPRLSEQLPANDKWRSAGGWWLGIADGRSRRRKGVARPELQPTIGGGKFQAAAANGDGWK